VATLAGNGALGYASAHTALFGRVTGVAFDPTQPAESPVIAVADASNFEIRLLRGPSCVQCEAGTYANQTAHATCTACPSGSWSAAGSNASTDCVCNAGFEGVAGGQCLLCPIGKFKAASGEGSCASCPIGKYGGYWGNGPGGVETSCDPCPANSNTSTSGSTVDQCECSPWHTQTFGSKTGDRTTATAPLAASFVSLQGPGPMPSLSDWTREYGVWFAMPSVGFPSAVQEAMLVSVGGSGNSFWSSPAPPSPHILCL